MPELWDHQKRGIALCGQRPATYLAWDMGVGKSRVIVEYVRAHRPPHVLICCPKPVVSVWPREFAKHWPDHQSAGVTIVPLVKGTVAARVNQARSTWKASQIVVYVINYEAAWRPPMADAFLKPAWDLIVCDEAHRIKSPWGKAARYFNRLGLRAAKRICLSGTPKPHSPLDIWSQFRFLSPGTLDKSFVVFRSKYAIMGGFQDREIKGFQKLDQLASSLAPLMNVVKRDEVLDLPPATHQVRHVTMPPKAWAAYKSLEKDLKAEIEVAGKSGKTITAANAMVSLLRMQQCTSGLVPADEGSAIRLHDGKRDALADLLEDVGPEENVVVFSRFRADLDAVHLAAQAAGRASVELSGRRNDVGSLWVPAAPGSVLAVNTQAGGVGIDLTAAAICVYFSGTWSLGDYDQSLARVHRPGQSRPVTYIHLVVPESIDQIIQQALEKRRDIVESVIEAVRRGSPMENGQ